LSGLAIYMEGGGDGKDSKAALRQGMDAFLSTLKDAARAKSWRWKLVCCGPRNAAYDGFRNAVRNNDDTIIVLLVDAELLCCWWTPKDQSRAHLARTCRRETDGT
jgi:hypothetical protein